MKILENNITRKLFWLNILAIVICSGIILLKNSALPDLVPLFYSLPWGTEQLVAKNILWFIPISSLFTLIINSVLNTILQKKTEDFFAILISAFSLVFSIMGTISLINIVFLIT